MQKLIEHISSKIEIEEGWREKVAAGSLALGLLTGATNVEAGNHHATKHKAKRQVGLPHKTYSEQDIIRSIAGEQSNNYQGMLAVACAIRNKMKHPYYKNNFLHGVAGRHAKHLKNESPKTFELAKKAWEESEHKDITNGAYLWGYDADLRKWKMEAFMNPKFWFNNVQPTVRVAGNTFFKDKVR